MKSKKSLLPLLAILIFTLSCELFDSEKKEKYRLLLESEYIEDKPVSKTIYSYDSDQRIKTIERYLNRFEEGIHESTEITEYTYSGNLVTVLTERMAGDLVLRSSSSEMEFDNELLVRKEDQLYSYNKDGLLVQWSNTEGRLKIDYEYNNEDLLRITEYQIRGSDETFTPNRKFEFDNSGNQVIGRIYRYDRNEEIWQCQGRIDRFYEDELLIQRDWYAIDFDGNEVLRLTDKYTFNESGDLEEHDSYYSDAEEHDVTTYKNFYDENDNLEEVQVNDKKYLFFWEKDKSNLDQLQLPKDPMNVYYGF